MEFLRRARAWNLVGMAIVELSKKKIR